TEQDENNWQTKRPKIAAEQCLRKQEHVKMKRAVIIRRIVFVETGLDHLIDKPAVDALIEMRRLHAEQKESQKRREADDDPRHPFAFGERVFPALHVIAEQWKIR